MFIMALGQEHSGLLGINTVIQNVVIKRYIAKTTYKINGLCSFMRLLIELDLSVSCVCVSVCVGVCVCVSVCVGVWV